MLLEAPAELVLLYISGLLSKSAHGIFGYADSCRAGANVLKTYLCWMLYMRCYFWTWLHEAYCRGKWNARGDLWEPEGWKPSFEVRDGKLSKSVILLWVLSESSVICHNIWFDALINSPKGTYFLHALTARACKKSWEIIFCLCVRLHNSLIPLWREDRKWIYCLEISVQKKRRVWIWLNDLSLARGFLGSALSCLSIPSNKAEGDSAGITFRAPFCSETACLRSPCHLLKSLIEKVLLAFNFFVETQHWQEFCTFLLLLYFC